MIDQKTVAEHAWLFYIMCTLLGAGFLWLFKRYINEGISAFAEAKESIKDLYAKYNKTQEDIGGVSDRVSRLEGEHNAIVKLGGHK